MSKNFLSKNPELGAAWMCCYLDFTRNFEKAIKIPALSVKRAYHKYDEVRTKTKEIAQMLSNEETYVHLNTLMSSIPELNEYIALCLELKDLYAELDVYLNKMEEAVFTMEDGKKVFRANKVDIPYAKAYSAHLKAITAKIGRLSFQVVPYEQMIQRFALYRNMIGFIPFNVTATKED